MVTPPCGSVTTAVVTPISAKCYHISFVVTPVFRLNVQTQTLNGRAKALRAHNGRAKAAPMRLNATGIVGDPHVAIEGEGTTAHKG